MLPFKPMLLFDFEARYIIQMLGVNIRLKFKKALAQKQQNFICFALTFLPFLQLEHTELGCSLDPKIKRKEDKNSVKMIREKKQGKEQQI